jgi:hypothetical protein
MQNGTISVRNLLLQQLYKIERKAPIKSLLYMVNTFNTKGTQAQQQQQQPEGDCLVVGSWDKTVSLYL